MERDQLLRAVRPFVIRLARRYSASFRCPCLEFADYKSIGYVAAVDALNRFRPRAGLPPNEVRALWIGFATRKIRGAMADAVRRAVRHAESAVPPHLLDVCGSRRDWPEWQSPEERTDELRTTLRRLLTAEEFRLADEHFFRGRTQASLAAELGCSQAGVSVRWRAILRKLKGIPEFADFMSEM